MIFTENDLLKAGPEPFSVGRELGAGQRRSGPLKSKKELDRHLRSHLSLELAVASGWTAVVFFFVQHCLLSLGKCSSSTLIMRLGWGCQSQFLTQSPGHKGGYMIQTQPIIAPCLPGPSGGAQACDPSWLFRAISFGTEDKEH